MALAVQLQGQGSSRIVAFRQRDVSATDAFGGDLRAKHDPCPATCGAAEGGCELRVLRGVSRISQPPDGVRGTPMISPFSARQSTSPSVRKCEIDDP